MKAAVLRAYHTPLEIEDLQLDAIAENEVLVETKACGICHSDLHCIEGGLPVPPPTVLGHEPAGIVAEVGSAVGHVRPGDHVIGCLSAFCGNCDYCTRGEPNLCGGGKTMRPRDATPRIRKGDETIHQFAHLSAFAEQMIVHENALVKIREDMPLDRAALIGCGVTTGLGAALNTARVRPGDTCVVIACGGVGLSAVQGCRIAGAAKIIAVDTVASKRELAQKLGATHAVDGNAEDAAEQIAELTGGGADYAFECIGTPGTCQLAFSSVRKGGNCVIVGVTPLGVTWPLPTLDLVLSGKNILGSMMGGNRFRIDMPRYVEFYLDGRLMLDEMISARIPLEEVNDAFEMMKTGEGARRVITFD